MRLYFSFGVFIALYVGWAFYRLFIKKAMKKHITDLYAMTFFIAITALFYCFLFY